MCLFVLQALGDEGYQRASAEGRREIVVDGGNGEMRSYECCFCSYRSFKRFNYERHMRTHTGERPYSCPHCPYRATRKISVDQHMIRHHWGTMFQTIGLPHTLEESSLECYARSLHYFLFLGVLSQVFLSSFPSKFFLFLYFPCILSRLIIEVRTHAVFKCRYLLKLIKINAWPNTNMSWIRIALYLNCKLSKYAFSFHKTYGICLPDFTISLFKMVKRKIWKIQPFILEDN